MELTLRACSLEPRRAPKTSALRIELDESVPEIFDGPGAVGPVSGGRGRGAIVGIIDSGIDLHHSCFCNDDGSTRILALWDQGLKAKPDETTPEPYGYGVVYDAADINSARNGGPPNSTHVIR